MANQTYISSVAVVRSCADALAGFGGILRCESCGNTQELGDIAVKLAHGWPKCCGYTMRWWTRRQLLEAALRG